MEYYIKDDAGNLYRTFDTPEQAIKFYIEEYEKNACEDDEKIESDTELSFAVAVDFDDPQKKKTFCVAEYGRFTNCTIAEIAEWEDWYDDEWIVPVVWKEEEYKYQYVLRCFSIEGLSPFFDLSFDKLFSLKEASICDHCDLITSEYRFNYKEFVEEFPEFSSKGAYLDVYEQSNTHKLTAEVRFVECWEINEDAECVEDTEIISKPETKTYKIEFPKLIEGDNFERYESLDCTRFQATNDANAKRIVSAMVHQCEKGVSEDDLLPTDFCVLDHVYRENADGEFVKVEF